MLSEFPQMQGPILPSPHLPEFMLARGSCNTASSGSALEGHGTARRKVTKMREYVTDWFQRSMFERRMIMEKVLDRNDEGAPGEDTNDVQR
jgi:hypothetical protein